MIKGKRVTKTVNSVERTTYCDFCGVDVDKQPSFYSRNEATVEMCRGEVYPDSDDREKVYIDICRACFAAKVVPAIEALGVKFHSHDADNYSYCDEMEKDAP
jgi:hypothetical protein